MAKFVKQNWKKILLLILVIAAILFFVFRSKKEDTKSAVIQKGEIKEVLVLSGEVNAVNYAKMGFETSGKISYVGVKEGEEVKKGRLLTKLDGVVLNTIYQQAMAALRAKEAAVENVHDQVKNNDDDESFSQKDTRTTAEAAKDSAYEAVIAAKRNLDGASLFAPFDGIVTYLTNPFAGVYAPLTQTQLEIVNPETMYFDVLADQTEVTKLKTGQGVEIILDSFEDKTFKGTVENISFVPKDGEAGSSYSIKVRFDGLDLKNSGFRIGMSGDAKFVIREKSDAFFVPSDFVNADKEGSYIKLGKKNNKKYIDTGLESEENTEIIGDFKEGQIVYD